jgi:hypothetical protein
VKIELEELGKEIDKFIELNKDLSKTSNLFTNYIDISKSNIIGLLKFLKMEKYKGVKFVKRKILPSITVEELKDCFNDPSMADLVVVDVNLEKTVENIKLKKGYNDRIARGIVSLLVELKEYEIEDLEILK